MLKKIDELIPQAGDSADFYPRLHSYISLLNTSWEQHISATNENEIHRFENVFNLSRFRVQVPESYYAFLREMGENDGGLITETLQNTVVSRKQLTDDHVEELKFDSALSESSYIPFCTSLISGAELSFDLTLKNPENIVVTYNGSDLVGYTNDTLEKLLFRCAFRRFYINSSPPFVEQVLNFSLIKFRIDEVNKFNNVFPNLQKYHDFIKQLEQEFKIEEAWFSNKDGYFNDYYVGVCDGCVVTMSHDCNTLFGTISGDNSSLMNQISECLSNISVIKYGALSPNTIF